MFPEWSAMERKLGVVGEMITACDIMSHPLQMSGKEGGRGRWRMGLGFGPSPFSRRRRNNDNNKRANSSAATMKMTNCGAEPQMNDGFPRIVPQWRSPDQNSMANIFPKGNFAAQAIDPVVSLPNISGGFGVGSPAQFVRPSRRLFRPGSVFPSLPAY